MGTRQLAMATTALGLWLKRACFPLQLDHVIDELDRHTEMRRRGAVRVTFFYEIHHPCPKFHWMGFAHVCLPMMLTNTESQIKQIGNPESHQREHALVQSFSDDLSSGRKGMFALQTEIISSFLTRVMDKRYLSF
jgi:hypothetical protein